jgi:hypothetical protein
LAAIAGAAPAIPAGAAAKPAKPTKADRTNAAKECKTLRGTTDETHEAFKARYKNLGACVSETAREQAAQRRAAKRHAARDCRAERNLDPEAFAEKYRTFGECVSAKAKQGLRESDREDRDQISEDKNAAKECGEERDSIGEKAFADKYGTNANKRNAFGKCVSGKSKDDVENEEPETPEPVS